MTFRRVDLGMTPVHLARINYAGDLGYELWVAPEYQRELFDRIVAAGEPHGLRLFGMRALMSLRLEKSYGTWFREYRPIYTPAEGGITRYIRLDHDFIGRAAHEAEMAAGGPKRRLVALVVEPDPDEPGRRHRRRADLARRRGRRLGDVRRVRPPRQASRSRSGYVPDGARDARRPGRRRLRDRDHRPAPAGAAPARAAVRPAGPPDAPVTDGSEAAVARPDRRRRPADRVRAGRLGRDRDPPGGRVARPRRDALSSPATAATASPRSTASPTSGPARSPARPGTVVERHPRDGKPPLPDRRPARPDAAAGRAGDRRSTRPRSTSRHRRRVERTRPRPRPSGRRRVLVLDAGDGDRGRRRSTRARRSSPATPGGMLHVRGRRDRRRDRARPRSSRSARAATSPGSLTAARRRAARARPASTSGRVGRRVGARRSVRFEGDDARAASRAVVTARRRRAPRRRRRATPRSSTSAGRRATCSPGWPADDAGAASSAPPPRTTRCRPPPTDRRRLPLHGHDRRRTSTAAWDKGYTELELLKRASWAGLGPCQGGACLPHVRAWIAARTGVGPGARSRPARPPARSRSPRPPPTSTIDAFRRTPLHDEHLALGARMDRFGGWWRPWHYGDVVGEYWAVREGVSIGDVSTLGKLVVVGPGRRRGARADLPVPRRRHQARPVALRAAAQRARPRDGRRDDPPRRGDAVRPDVHVRRRGQRRDVDPRLDRHVGPPRPRHGPDDVPRRDQRHGAARDGAARGGSGSPEPPRFLGHVRAEVAGVPCHVMRLSFTGEAAFELHHPIDRSVELWRALMDAGARPRDPAARAPGAVRAAAREGPRDRRHGHRARHDAAAARHGLGGPDGEAGVHRPGRRSSGRRSSPTSGAGSGFSMDGRGAAGGLADPVDRRRRDHRQRHRQLDVAAARQGADARLAAPHAVRRPGRDRRPRGRRHADAVLRPGGRSVPALEPIAGLRVVADAGGARRRALDRRRTSRSSGSRRTRRSGSGATRRRRSTTRTRSSRPRRASSVAYLDADELARARRSRRLAAARRSRARSARARSPACPREAARRRHRRCS